MTLAQLIQKIDETVLEHYLEHGEPLSLRSVMLRLDPEDKHEKLWIRVGDVLAKTPYIGEVEVERVNAGRWELLSPRKRMLRREIHALYGPEGRIDQ